MCDCFGFRADFFCVWFWCLGLRFFCWVFFLVVLEFLLVFLCFGWCVLLSGIVGFVVGFVLVVVFCDLLVGRVLVALPFFCGLRLLGGFGSWCGLWGGYVFRVCVGGCVCFVRVVWLGVLCFVCCELWV